MPCRYYFFFHLGFLACVSNPCLDHGTCIDFAGEFFCMCPGGVIGHQCEKGRCVVYHCIFRYS